MKLFRTDPDDSLRAAEQALQQVSDRIRQLEIERAAKLADPDCDIAEVGKIDREIVSLNANAGVHRDRITAMQERRRELELARREQQRVAAVSDIKTKLAARTAAASKLDRALHALVAAFNELTVADEHVYADWSELLPPPAFINYTRASTIGALSTARLPRPMAPGLVRDLVNRAPLNFVLEVEKRNNDLIAELDAEPVGASEDVA